MYREAFKKLELEEIATILDQVNPLLDGVPFDPVESVVLSWDIPFYPGYQFLELQDHSSVPVIKRHVIYKIEHLVVLDWTNELIYSLNQSVPLNLTSQTVIDYIIFFFTYVRGKHGRFLIAENVDDIQWKDEPPPNARKAISKLIEPVHLLDQDGQGGYKLNACMMFKNSLFKSDVSVDKNGYVAMENEELLIEDIPVLDDVFGQ